ncbi:MAG: gamma-glutamylcyclotransferase [Spirochaetota bacterium]
MMLFVYGTLLKHQPRNHELPVTSYRGYAFLPKVLLYDLGDYPGIVTASLSEVDDFVVGELYEVDNNIISKVDSIEGYTYCDENSSLYLCKKVNVYNSYGKEVSAYTYYFNMPLNDAVLIQHGDYRRYLLERSDDEYSWIAAYGSNMDYSRLQERVGDAIKIKRGYIPGYALRFNKIAKSGQEVFANICFSIGDQCPCVLYLLTKKQINELDKWEGVPEHYIRITVPVLFDGNDDEKIVQVYIAHPLKIDEDTSLKPLPTYLEHIKKGYTQNGFDISF